MGGLAPPSGDRDANRLYAANTAYPGASQVYQYDTLNRLGQYKAGLINTGNTDTQAYWTRSGQRWTLDATGNPTAVDEWDNGSGGFANWRQATYDRANKLTATSARANLAKSPRTDPFTSAATAANWAKPGSGDAFNVNTSTAGALTVTAVAQDTAPKAGGNPPQLVQEPAAQAPLFYGPPMGGGWATVTGVFPSGTTAGQMGLAFGYKGWPNYWDAVWDLDGHLKSYQQGSTATLQTSGSWPGITAGSNQALYWLAGRRRLWVSPSTDFPTSGVPTGSVGLFANVANTKFTGYKLWDDADSRNLAGRWTDWAPNADGLNAVSPASSGNTGRLRFSSNPYANTRPVMLSNLRLQRFQAVFSVKRESTATSNSVDLVFNGSDLDSFDTLQVYHSNTKAAPHGHVQPDGSDGPVSSETQTTANMPTTGSSDILWVQVTADGTGSVTAKEQVNNTGTPTAASWPSVANCYSSSSFRSTGGMVGFKGESSAISVGGLTVSSWDAATSAYDIVEAYEPFGVNTTSGSGTYGFASDTPVSDANGNLLYDGSQVYTYDAWSQLRTVSHGYRDTSGTLQHGQAFDTMSYDGLGRRISKAVINTGQWDCTYQYYLDHDSVVEERNGSNQPAKQFVWGTRYIDELVQTSVNSNPSGQTTCDVSYWACGDANWNVVAVVSASGAMAERYEYTPYGQRQVFYSAGSNDVAGYAPTFGSRRVVTSTSVTEPWGVCEIGHQGLLHDEECGLLYDRLRSTLPQLGRFLSRDPIGNADSLSLYEYLQSMPIGIVDPSGLAGVPHPAGGAANARRNELDWQKWEKNQKAKVEGALSALCNACVGTKSTTCFCKSRDDCHAQAHALADAIVNQVRDWRRNTAGDIHSSVADSGWFQDLWPGSSTRACGDWQREDKRTLISANQPFVWHGGKACFGLVEGNAYSYVEHNWIEISCRSAAPGTPGTFVTIDPWPTGGVDIVDTSEVDTFWAGHIHRKVIAEPYTP